MILLHISNLISFPNVLINYIFYMTHDPWKLSFVKDTGVRGGRDTNAVRIRDEWNAHSSLTPWGDKTDHSINSSTIDLHLLENAWRIAECHSKGLAHIVSHKIADDVSHKNWNRHSEEVQAVYLRKWTFQLRCFFLNSFNAFLCVMKYWKFNWRYGKFVFNFYIFGSGVHLPADVGWQ